MVGVEEIGSHITFTKFLSLIYIDTSRTHAQGYLPPPRATHVHN